MLVELCVVTVDSGGGKMSVIEIHGYEEGRSSDQSAEVVQVEGLASLDQFAPFVRSSGDLFPFL